MRDLMYIALLFLLSGCMEAVKPNIPEQVIVTVEKYKKLPPWAVEALPVPTPANGTVGARLESENLGKLIIEYANCRSKLLIKLDQGDAVDEKACNKGPFQ